MVAHAHISGGMAGGMEQHVRCPYRQLYRGDWRSVGVGWVGGGDWGGGGGGVRTLRGRGNAGRGGTWAERRVKGTTSPSTTSHVALLTGSTTSALACGGPTPQRHHHSRTLAPCMAVRHWRRLPFRAAVCTSSSGSWRCSGAHSKFTHSMTTVQLAGIGQGQRRNCRVTAVGQEEARGGTVLQGEEASPWCSARGAAPGGARLRSSA